MNESLGDRIRSFLGLARSDKRRDRYWIERFYGESLQRAWWYESRSPFSAMLPTATFFPTMGRYEDYQKMLMIDSSPKMPLRLEWREFQQVARDGNPNELERFLRQGWVPNPNYQKPLPEKAVTQ